MNRSKPNNTGSADTTKKKQQNNDDGTEDDPAVVRVVPNPWGHHQDTTMAPPPPNTSPPSSPRQDEFMMRATSTKLDDILHTSSPGSLRPRPTCRAGRRPRTRSLSSKGDMFGENVDCGTAAAGASPTGADDELMKGIDFERLKLPFDPPLEKQQPSLAQAPSEGTSTTASLSSSSRSSSAAAATAAQQQETAPRHWLRGRGHRNHHGHGHHGGGSTEPSSTAAAF